MERSQSVHLLSDLGRSEMAGEASPNQPSSPRPTSRSRISRELSWLDILSSVRTRCGVGGPLSSKKAERRSKEASCPRLIADFSGQLGSQRHRPDRIQAVDCTYRLQAINGSSDFRGKLG